MLSIEPENPLNEPGTPPDGPERSPKASGIPVETSESVVNSSSTNRSFHEYLFTVFISILVVSSIN